MIEETVYDWHDWVRAVLKLPAEWREFYVVNAVVGLLGISCAVIGLRNPGPALILPAFMLVNAILFHVTPAVLTRRFPLALFTAIILFLPIGIYYFLAAAKDGVLTVNSVVISGVAGFMIMMSPIVFQKTKHLAFFRQDRS